MNEDPKLVDEMAAEAAPLSSVEKKLIGWSLALGLGLLVVLVLATGVLAS